MNGLLFIDDEKGVRRSVIRALKKSKCLNYCFILTELPVFILSPVTNTAWALSG